MGNQIWGGPSFFLNTGCTHVRVGRYYFSNGVSKNMIFKTRNRSLKEKLGRESGSSLRLIG